MSSELTVAYTPPADKEYRKVNQTRKNKKPPKYRSEPFKCPVCRKTWQYKPINDTDFSAAPDYLDDFPSYGCTVNICNMCKE